MGVNTGLENRVYLITGAALNLPSDNSNCPESINIEDVDISHLNSFRPNLGGAYALELAKHSPRAIIFCDIRQRNLRALERVLQNAGVEARGFQIDVTDEQKCRDLVKHIVDTYGSLDGVVANAGYCKDAFFQKMTAQQWQSVVGIHEKGFWNIIKPAFDYVRSKETAEMNLLAITSTSGLFGNFSQVGYGGGKMLVVGAMQSLAEEIEFKARSSNYHWNVVANCMAPLASTEMTGDLPITISPVYGERFCVDFKDPKIKEKYSPQAVAPMVAYLLSQKALGVVCKNGKRLVDPKKRLNKRIFYAGGGEFREVVIGFQRGFQLDDPNLSDVASNVGRVYYDNPNVLRTSDFPVPNLLGASFELYLGMTNEVMRFVSRCYR